MKRVLFLASISLLAAPLSRAQESPTAASLSEISENYKVLKGNYEDLNDKYTTIQHQLDDLQKKVDALTAQQQSKPSADSVTQDDVKALKDAIQAVDQKRMQDNDKIVKTLQDISSKLGKTTTLAVSTPARTAAPVSNTRTETGPEPSKPDGPGFMYEVKPDDTPGKIARKLFDEKGIKITGQQIMQANPQVKDATKLYIGQKLFIPVPKTTSTDTANNN